MNDSHLPFWLASLYLPGVGPRTMLRWLTQFPDVGKLFTATDNELKAMGISAKHIYALQHPDWPAVEKDLVWAEKAGHHLISLEDEDYPRLLKEIADPPLVLYVWGNKAALKQTQLAMVGARNATTMGRKNAEQFACHLAETGFAITSGLAAGIDYASHRGALLAKGITIGVSGTGLNQIYPKAHQSLVEEIVTHQGAVISEFPLETPPFPSHFPRRNRIISGLAVGVLVVEAALQSGSLITVRHALEQGREVFAIPGSIHHPLARGCHHLIRQGAKLVETSADIIEELNAYRGIFNAHSLNEPVPIDLSGECQQLLEKIGHETTPMDMILLRSGLTASEVSSILLALELQGYIQSVAGGYVRIFPNH